MTKNKLFSVWRQVIDRLRLPGKELPQPPGKELPVPEKEPTGKELPSSANSENSPLLQNNETQANLCPLPETRIKETRVSLTSKVKEKIQKIMTPVKFVISWPIRTIKKRRNKKPD